MYTGMSISIFHDQLQVSPVPRAMLIYISFLEYLASDKTLGEKDLEQHKISACYFEQILEGAPPKKKLSDHLPLISQTIQIKRTK